MIAVLAGLALAADPDAELCKLARVADDDGIWAEYLERYPEGPCAADALAALKRADSPTNIDAGPITAPTVSMGSLESGFRDDDVVSSDHTDVVVLSLVVDSPLEKDSVRARLRPVLGELASCFEAARSRNSALGDGHVDVRLRIGSDGSVTRVDLLPSTIPSTAFQLCAKSAWTGLTLSAPAISSGVAVEIALRDRL